MSENAPFELERRYEVFKLTDIAEALTEEEREVLEKLGDKVNDWRINQFKRPLKGVFVEDNWPEYEPTVSAIEQRVNSGR